MHDYFVAIDADIDNYEDLVSDVEDIEDQEVSTPADKGLVSAQKVTETDTGTLNIPKSDTDRAKEKKKKTMIEKAEKELPYTFKGNFLSLTDTIYDTHKHNILLGIITRSKVTVCKKRYWWDIYKME